MLRANPLSSLDGVAASFDEDPSVGALPARGMRRQLLPSLIAYAIGTGGLYLLDLYLASTLRDHALAEWAYFRSVLLIGGPLAVFGLDQALLRARVTGWRPIAVISGHLVAAAVTIGVASGLFGPTDAVPVSLSVLGFSIAILAGGHLRANYRITQSVVILNVWRAVLLVAVVGRIRTSEGPVSLPPIAMAVLVAWVVPSLLAARAARADPDISILPLGGFYRLGSSYWLLAVVASASLYIDQVVLNASGDVSASADFLKYTTYFAQPFVFVVGFAGNIVNPYFRRRGNEIRQDLRRLTLGLAIVGVVVSASAALVGPALQAMSGGAFTEWNPLLAAAAVAAGAGRLFYLLPSGVVGVFGTRAELGRLALGNGASVALLPLTYAGAVLSGADPLWAIAVAALVSVWARAAQGWLLMRKITMSGRVLTARV